MRVSRNAAAFGDFALKRAAGTGVVKLDAQQQQQQLHEKKFDAEAPEDEDEVKETEPEEEVSWSSGFWNRFSQDPDAEPRSRDPADIESRESLLSGYAIFKPGRLEDSFAAGAQTFATRIGKSKLV